MGKSSSTGKRLRWATARKVQSNHADGGQACAQGMQEEVVAQAGRRARACSSGVPWERGQHTHNMHTHHTHKLGSVVG